MTTLGLVLTGLAALVHVFIFWLESLAWTGERARRTFGTTPQEAAATRELAFNQGFYNLFLAVLVGVGTALFTLTSHREAGAALVFAGAGSMVAASLVLLLSSPDKRAAALKQGVIPALGVVALAVGLAA